MKFGLSDEQIRQIQNILFKFPAIIEAVVFGSRAMGNYKEASDVDIALKGDLSSSVAADVKYELEEETYLPFFFDVVAYSMLDNAKLKEHIDKYGVSLYRGGWKECKLGDLITLEYGKSLKDNQESCRNYPVYGTNGRIGCTDKFLSPIPSIIVGRKGAYRGVHFSNYPFFVIDTAFYVKPTSEDIDLRFLYNFLLNQDINAMDSGSAIPSTDRYEIYDIDILLPPLSEQRAIALILSSLDDKIDLLHRQNKTLEAMAETLFRQWFVEEADEGWEEKPLSELLTITSSKRIFYSEYVTSGVPFYRSKEIIELRNTGSTNSELYISEDRFNEIDEKFGSPKTGDILMTSVGTPGVPYRVRKGDKFYFKDGNLTWVKEFKEIPSSIIYFWLLSKNGQEELASITIGSTQEALTIEGLKSINFKLPSKENIANYP